MEKIDDEPKITVQSLLEASLSTLKAQNEAAYNVIIQKAKSGYFEEHESPGSLKSLARSIISASDEN